MCSADDNLLIQDLAAGQEAAFAVLYDRFAVSLFRVALAMLGSRPDAEDAVQEVFVSLVRSRNRLAGVRNLRAYLLASLRHTAIQRATNCSSKIRWSSNRSSGNCRLNSARWSP